MSLVVKNPLANAGDVRDTVQSLGQEDPLEKGMATHSGILAWRIPWTEESGRLQSTGSHRVRHNWSDLAQLLSLNYCTEMSGIDVIFFKYLYTAKETLMYRTVLWTLWERERVGRFGRMALIHVKYHVWNELPVQVRRTILDAWGWCTGTTQRDGMGREEGGGFRMGNTCIPVVDSFWYLAKLIHLCKV